jgi:hypothetical protein
MPSHNPPLLPSAPDPLIYEELCAARNSADVIAIQQRHEAESIQQTWPHLPYVQRCALLLARAFNGDIFHDLDTSDFGEPDSF